MNTNENRSIIKAKVFAEASSNKIIEDKEKFLIYVKAKKKNQAANQNVVKLLAKKFKIGENNIKIIKGLKSQNKTLEILW